MSLKDSVEESVGWALRRLEQVRLRYMDAIQQAERQGGSRLEDIRRQVEQLGPGLRHLVDEQVETLQHKLDEINRRLAEEAVPEERKSRVGRLALERKAASAAKMASSVMRSRTSGKEAGKTASEASAAPTSSSKTPEPSTSGSKRKGSRSRKARTTHKSKGASRTGEPAAGAERKSRTSS